MSDSHVTVQNLKDEVKTWFEDRGWYPRDAKESAIQTVTEAAELLECFRFKSTISVDPLDVADELSDTLAGLICVALAMDIDISTAVRFKLFKSADKYPPLHHPDRSTHPIRASEMGNPSFPGVD